MYTVDSIREDTGTLKCYRSCKSLVSNDDDDDVSNTLDMLDSLLFIVDGATSWEGDIHIYGLCFLIMLPGAMPDVIRLVLAGYLCKRHV